jgi:hypothetical protein
VVYTCPDNVPPRRRIADEIVRGIRQAPVLAHEERPRPPGLRVKFNRRDEEVRCMSQAYDRTKFVEEARAAEAARLAKLDEFIHKNEAWVKEHGPLPFQAPKLIFDGK